MCYCFEPYALTHYQTFLLCEKICMEKKIESHGENEDELSSELERLLTTSPKAKIWNGVELCKYQGFLSQSKYLRGMIRFC